MKEKIKIRIGVFLYDWAIETYTKDFVIGLAEEGCEVDFFYKDPGGRPHYFADVDQFALCESIRFFNLKPVESRASMNIFGRLMRKLMPSVYKIIVRNKPSIVIDDHVLMQSRQIVAQSSYDCFIGIEKKGLIWAGILSQMFTCPVIYYSLELYVEDHPDLQSFSHLRGAEKMFHQRSRATIIQDELRCAVLLQSNGVPADRPVIYFPICVRGDIHHKSIFLHEKFDIDGEKKIILYFGSMFGRRYLEQLVGMADNFIDNTVLVVMGHGTDSYREHLQSIAKSGKVIASNNFVPEKEIIDVVSSAHIGVALFDITYANDRLIAFSSHKIAYYLQCGVPIIVMNTKSSQKLMRNFKCGELIDSVDEIPQKVQMILADYSQYRDQAYLAFKTYFSFDRSFPIVNSQICSLLVEVFSRP